MSEHIRNPRYLAIHVANISPYGRFADPQHHPIRWVVIMAILGVAILCLTH